MKSHTFTTEDYSKFESKVQQYMKELGVTGWQMDVRQEHIGHGTCAQLDYNIVARKAIIRLTETVEYDYAVTTDPEELAKHEVLHLLLADLCWTPAHEQDYSCDAVISKEHDVINKLLAVL